MNVLGKEVNLFLSVGAFNQITSLPDNTSNFMKNAATIAIMSQAYEDRRHAEDQKYVSNPITLSEVLALSKSEFEALVKEMEKAIKEGLERTVEVEEDKKKEIEISN